MNARMLALPSAAVVTVALVVVSVASMDRALAERSDASRDGRADPPIVAAPAPVPASPNAVPATSSMRRWDVPFEFEAHELPDVARREGVTVYGQLGPRATAELRTHLERNYRGTLQWIERNRDRESSPEQIRREAIELARDQAKLEYFDRGLYWLVGSQPGTMFPPTELFRFEGHDVTFVKGVLDDDGVHKFLITYVSHDHPLLAEARSL